MTAIFVSYSRRHEAAVRVLADDLGALGHSVWLDKALTGGQAWWDQILDRIRGCDVFVLALAPDSLSSTACEREWSYAAALKKPILPVLVADDVSLNLLPSALSAIQVLDYRDQSDRGAAFRLAKSVAAIPPAPSLPEPLPDPPEVPVSYLGSVKERISSTTSLSFEQQSALVVDLRRSLRDAETAADARALLELLRARRDLLATIADEIDEILKPAGHTASQGSTGERVTGSLGASQTEPERLVKAGAEPPGRRDQRAQPGAGPAASDSARRPWYDNTQWLVVAMLLFWPVGVYGILKSHQVDRRWKVLVLTLIGAAVLLAIASEIATARY